MRVDLAGGARRLPEALRQAATRRVLLALSRFAGNVRRVTVRLDAPPNPLGGIDQRCRIHVRLQADQVVGGQAIDGAIEGAVARAAAQLARRLGALLPGDAARGRPKGARNGPRGWVTGPSPDVRTPGRRGEAHLRGRAPRRR